MKTSPLVIITLAAAVGCGAAVVLLKDRRPNHAARPAPAGEGEPPLVRRDAAPPPLEEEARSLEKIPGDVPAEPTPPAPAPPPAEQSPEPAAPPPTQPPVVAAPPPPPAAEAPAARPNLPKPPKKAQKSGKNAVPPAERPLARQALALVGADPAAEAFWVEAINDPTRSINERKDLIEDLNEEGFDDPKNLTPDDLPLIESRLALIEQLAPESMDDVNLAAFAEAYKDLVNMYARVAGR